MTRTLHYDLHRTARLGNLGTLTVRAGELYYWYLENVYDLRFPHVGDGRHGHLPHTFDALRVSAAQRLRWKRQSAYVAHVKLCRRCHSVHHEHHDCD